MGQPSLKAPAAITKAQSCWANRGLAYLGWGRGDLLSAMAAKEVAGEENLLKADAQSERPGHLSQPGLKQSESVR